MTDTNATSGEGFVFKEVRGSELEKHTSDGWEFVDDRTSVGPFGFHGAYLVKRPRQKPDVIKLAERIDELNGQVAKVDEVCNARLKMLVDALNRMEAIKKDLQIDFKSKESTKDFLATRVDRAFRDLDNIQRHIANYADRHAKEMIQSIRKE